MSSLAETAQLVVALKLKDEMSGGISRAKGQLTGLDQRAHATATGSFARLQSSATGVGGALKHAGQQMKNLALGFGIGAGLAGGASIIGFFEQGIDKARVFGTEVLRLSKLTGESVPEASRLASVLEHFGVTPEQATRSIGFLEKNVGLLSVKDSSAADSIGKLESKLHRHLTALQRAMLIYPKAGKFVTDFGLQLFTANGRLKNANELLLTSADYFNNKQIPAATKAAALAKLYGRSWQDLIPVLSAGTKGIMDAADEAERLGLVMTKDNIADLAKLKTATREWNTSLGGLQLQLGLLLLGPLTDLSKAATNFISNPDNRRGILGFFKGVLTTAQGVAGVIANTVIPTVQSLVGTAKSIWDSIPGPMRDLLVKGLAADRVIKFTFGFSPISLLGGALKGALGGLFERGGSPANPMWVATVGGGLGGGPGEAGGGLLAKGASALGIGTGTLLAGIGITAIAAAAVGAVALYISSQNSERGHAIRDNLAPNIAGKSDTEIAAALAGVRQGIHDLESNPLTVLVRGDALDSLHQMEAALVERKNNTTIQAHNVSERRDTLRSPKDVLKSLATLGIDLNAIHKAQLSNLSATQHVDADTRHAGSRAAVALGHVAADTRHAGSVTAGRLNTANAKIEALRHKRTSFRVNNVINVSTRVSVSDIQRQARYTSRVARTTSLSAS